MIFSRNTNLLANLACLLPYMVDLPNIYPYNQCFRNIYFFPPKTVFKEI